MPPNKSRWASKTIWLGVLMTVVSVLGLIAGEEWIQNYPVVVSILGLIAGVLTVVVRHFTSQPLASLNGDKQRWR